jgi:myo-inositol 2-dehydrogenase/D-chiro-inositol 1-dehydrogenase
MAKQVNIAVIGTGRMGSVHTRNLARLIPEANLVAVCDIRIEVAQAVADELGIQRAVKDYHELLADKDIEAILIATSTDTHAFIMKDVAAAGKHIFCEKPIDYDLGRIDHALAAVDAAGVKLQIGFNRRFDPNFRRVRDVVAAGQIGQPHVLRITSRDPQPPPIAYVKVSGGIFLDMTIHDFDMARFLMGEDVDEVYAAGGVLVDPAIGEAGDVDTALITLRFQSGALGAIDNSRKAVYGYDQRVEVFGSDGMVAVSNNLPNSAVVSSAQAVTGSLPLFFFVERYTESYIAEMKAFVEAVLQDKTPPVTGPDGRKPVVMGYAAAKSYRENRPVRLSEVDIK